jgi:CheY-like chemotaxis protein
MVALSGLTLSRLIHRIHHYAAASHIRAKPPTEHKLSTYIVVVDDEPDVEGMFKQHFRRDLRSGRFVMEFALSAPAALEKVKAIPDPSLILILSDINMPGMTGLEMLSKVKAERPNVRPSYFGDCRMTP